MVIPVSMHFLNIQEMEGDKPFLFFCDPLLYIFSVAWCLCECTFQLWSDFVPLWT